MKNEMSRMQRSDYKAIYSSFFIFHYLSNNYLFFIFHFHIKRKLLILNA